MTVGVLLSPNAADVLGGVVDEFSERAGCRKRGMALAADALAIAIGTLRKAYYNERPLSARVATATRWAGLTLAQERVDRLRDLADAESADFARLSRDVENRLVAHGLDAAARAAVGRVRRGAGARGPGVPAARRADRRPHLQRVA